MFGYVNISSENISEEDKSLYQSYYCGLCKAIGRKSQIFRMGLNNDLTFLTVLLSAVIKDEPEKLNKQACILHCVKKHDEIYFNKVLDYTSDINIILVYLKICDDATDLKNFAKKSIKRLLKNRVDSVLKKYKNLGDYIKNELNKLSDLEKQKSPSIDETADCFAKILEAIFTPDFIEDNNTKKILAWIGYNIGRWIYIVDAYDDLEKDKKRKNYNPFIYSRTNNSNKLKEDTYNALVCTLSNAANAYDLLKIHRNDTLLRNILYSGLFGKMNSIFVGMEEKNEPV